MTAYSDLRNARNEAARSLVRERDALAEARDRLFEMKRFVAPRAEQAEARQVIDDLVASVAALEWQVAESDKRLAMARTSTTHANA